MLPRPLIPAPATYVSRGARRAIKISQPGFIALALFGVCAGTRAPSENVALPFSVGEKLTYEVRVGSGGKIGTATMWIEGPVDVRGTSTYVLRFDSKIRYFKHEANPLTRNDEAVDLFPDQKEWKSAKGEIGQSPTSTPLDELSFMYFIRTLPMTPGATYRFDRHFDTARNPVTVTVIRREVIPTPMGELRVFLVEMRVRDPRHYKGEGVIKIYLTDDDCRLPAKIESTMPVIGTAILTIDSQNSPCKKPGN